MLLYYQEIPKNVKVGYSKQISRPQRNINVYEKESHLKTFYLDLLQNFGDRDNIGKPGQVPAVHKKDMIWERI